MHIAIQNNLETVIQTKLEVKIRQHFGKIYIKTDYILLISCFIQSIRLLNKKTVISWKVTEERRKLVSIMTWLRSLG